uniref:Uncharacterized protein n=1 Tax=Rhizophora mucronata TaxID=61149 RepID=A0A2P2ITJ0_RHIMU
MYCIHFINSFHQMPNSSEI